MNKMKLFKIELDNVGYDDYDSCVIVAESKEQVEELCKCNFVKYEEWDTNRVNYLLPKGSRLRASSTVG